MPFKHRPKMLVFERGGKNGNVGMVGEHIYGYRLLDEIIINVF